MLDVYVRHTGRLGKLPAPSEIPTEAVWIDMVRPTAAEEAQVEAALGIDVPTHDEMQEIEVSSRLYEEDGCQFMTATILSKQDTAEPVARPVTFVLTPDRLVTIRYTEPKAFEIFGSRCLRPGGKEDAAGLLIGLLDAIVDRAADTLERLSAETDTLSAEVFRRDADDRRRGVEYQEVLRDIGRKGELNAKILESLLTLGRVTTYLSGVLAVSKPGRDVRARVKTLGRDVTSLTDHAHFLADRVTFLLDATLGLINIEQNAIIKIVSIATLVFLPPTGIASIYGMNFQHMPELAWPWGYPMALALMMVSAILPYAIFRRLGWL